MGPPEMTVSRVVGFSSPPFSQRQPAGEEHHSLKTLVSPLTVSIYGSSFNKMKACFLGHFQSFSRQPLKQTGPITTPGLCKRSWSLCLSSHSEQGLACSLPVSLCFSPSTTPLPPGIPTLNWTPEQMLLGQGWGPGASRYQCFCVCPWPAFTLEGTPVFYFKQSENPKLTFQPVTWDLFPAASWLHILKPLCTGIFIFTWQKVKCYILKNKTSNNQMHYPSQKRVWQQYKTF